MLDRLFPALPLLALLALTCVPTVLLGFAFVRHAKAIYLAIDHFFDPHVKGVEAGSPPRR